MRLRSLVAATSATLTGLALCAALALVLITSRMAAQSEEVVEGLDSIAAVGQLQAALLIHDSVLKELVAARDAVRVDALIAAERDAWENLQRASRARTEEERRALAELRSEMTTYLDESESILVVPKLPQERLDARIRRLSQLLALAERIEAERTLRAEQTALVIERWSVRANWLGYGASILLLCGVALVVWGQRRWISSPLERLHRAITLYGDGPPAAIDTRAAVKELRELDRAFRELSERLADQKARQLSFVAGVAHDLKNPLAALGVSAGMLRRIDPTERPSAIADHAARIERQAARLRGLLDDLLDTSRIEAGRIDLRLEEHDLVGLVRDVVELQRDAAADHRLVLDTERASLPLRIDAQRISQILHNLLGNAIKYSPRGGTVRVTVAVEARDAVVAVEDQGIGIPAEELPRIFEPFRRTPDSRAGFPGAGLGLSVARRIARSHGGDIEVESTPGVGSVFRLRIPLERRPGTAHVRGEDGLPA